MRLSTNKLFRLSLSLTLINVLFPCLLVSADLRQRNIIISKSKNTALSSNNTDVININNPSQNGISHNQFDAFDIHKGVIFNNSLEDGISKIGGAIEKNPNLTKNASVIVSEITSKQASQINGILEVFGKKLI
ncbi:filamentous hemagglutinin N-terminal domain-containing protein [Campylobacter fetus subsp. venerealis]|nr:filamentous hemagglutinin N-terminal domain-containing protein [Campylobacter fetus]EAK0835132.1 filamentous hemagglutinin N-terminal domain-containing protein [Campylobacter fetus]KAA3685177.1 filamentous hemagglutinin N-terminal domain-containing protein [Campylobacter fetus subsp. venerealis]CDF65161.1 Putative large exoprotein involved in heme utilization or adhesion of ShlA/HecA/FhaA family [Campylobacter fetus subsp. venerealis str. 84-112]